jgi:hypothetical protein
VYAAAAIVGFAFFLMELVWYRMLGPILGGTTYTFGLILAVALLGIGLGGAAYSAVFARRRPSLRDFALTCLLEAAALAVPFVLGDRLALRAGLFDQANVWGFLGTVAGWTIIAGVVILPAAFLSGIQFPLLIALVGQARRNVGQQIGAAFAWNTVGAIAGSLAGGFGLLPWLTAPGAWQAVVVLLVILGVVAAFGSWRREKDARWLVGHTATAAAALALLWAAGPSAVWRHSGIGAGRAVIPVDSVVARRNWIQSRRRSVVWEAEGVEASIALVDAQEGGLSFVVNGKCDGSAVGDAPTQITSGMLGGLLQGGPQSAFIVGLGTGETAGWIAAMPTIRNVDVAEIEPAVDEMARQAADFNFHVLKHPKVRRIYNDAREVLLTSPARYDLIFSEPSNPYRSGIASLYTCEFYEVVRSRLNPRGLLIQWLQGYEIDFQTVRTVLATLHSVFPHVEVWRTREEDMLLVCSMDPIRYDIDGMRRRMAAEPYRTAFAKTWRATTVEGVLSYFVAGEGLVEQAGRQEGNQLNTDDCNRIEYGFARSLGRHGKSGFSIAGLRDKAVEAGAERPQVQGKVDWEAVEDFRQVAAAVCADGSPLPPHPTAAQKARAEVFRHYWHAETAATVAAWERAGYAPVFPTEVSVLSLCYADVGSEKARPLLDRLRKFQPVEADIIEAYFHARRKQYGPAAASLCRSLIGLRQDPWVLSHVVELVFPTALDIAAHDRSQAARLCAALDQPFALRLCQDDRQITMAAIAQMLGPRVYAESLAGLEPYVPWQEQLLKQRATVYRAIHHPLAEAAEEEWQAFLRDAEADREAAGKGPRAEDPSIRDGGTP